MASWEPTERVEVPSAQQSWESLTFVHFACDRELVAGLLPEPLEPDLFDGRAWIGVTPFRLRAAVLPAAPGPRATYVEMNVRTYVRDDRGRDGIWFLSLELDQPAVAAALRTLTGLPYRWSDTWIDDRGSTVGYGTDRHPPHRSGSLQLQVEIGEPLAAPSDDSLETFLVGRWRAFTERSGQLLHVPVEHAPWPLARAEVTSWRSDGLIEGLGLPEPEGVPHVLYSPGVDVKLGLPQQ